MKPMRSNKYRFVTKWSVEGDVTEVANLINQPELLTRWWPSVYLEINKKKENGRETFYLFTKGWLPYTLRWHFFQTKADLPHRLELEAAGDLKGYGIWKFRQNGKQVEVEYDWEVDANKPILKYLSFIFKPVFSFNHHWAMRKGEESLKMELARLKAGKSRQDAPQPPMPSFGYRKYYRQNLALAGE
jgi:hypothetical protein